MRVLILIFFVMTFFVKSVHGQEQLPQNYDSLVLKITKMDAAINRMHLNMVQSHRQFKVGTAMLIGGTVIAGLAALSNGNSTATNQLAIIGGTFMVAGGVIQIDSHKFIGRGGKKKK